MTAEHLEELLAIMNSGGDGDGEAFTFLCAIAPSLTRRVIAAENLADAVQVALNGEPGKLRLPPSVYQLRPALTAYREASK